MKLFKNNKYTLPSNTKHMRFIHKLNRSAFYTLLYEGLIDKSICTSQLDHTSLSALTVHEPKLV